MKNYESNRAVCPYYRHETGQVIYCDGVVPACVTHHAFANKTDAKAYKEKYCRSAWEMCRMARTLEEISYETEYHKSNT